MGDREIILGKLATWRAADHNGRKCDVENEAGAAELSYEPYALMTRKERPDVTEFVQRRIHAFFSNRRVANAYFAAHFKGKVMSPTLAYLFLLNAVDEERCFDTPRSRARTRLCSFPTEGLRHPLLQPPIARACRSRHRQFDLCRGWKGDHARSRIGRTVASAAGSIRRGRRRAAQSPARSQPAPRQPKPRRRHLCRHDGVGHHRQGRERWTAKAPQNAVPILRAPPRQKRLRHLVPPRRRRHHLEPREAGRPH